MARPIPVAARVDRVSYAIRNIVAEARAVEARGLRVLFISGYIGGGMVFDKGIGVARMSKSKWAKIARAGRDVTIVSFARGMVYALDADRGDGLANELARELCAVEGVDLVARRAGEEAADRREALLVNMDGRAAGIVTRADLLESVARPGTLDRAHHHPRFDGWEPGRRSSPASTARPSRSSLLSTPRPATR